MLRCVCLLLLWAAAALLLLVAPCVKAISGLPEPTNMLNPGGDLAAGITRPGATRSYHLLIAGSHYPNTSTYASRRKFWDVVVAWQVAECYAAVSMTD